MSTSSQPNDNASCVNACSDVTSPCQTGLVVLAMMADRRSCPWWLKTGKTLLFPGWMDIFRYGSGLKNIPFFRPVARKSEEKASASPGSEKTRRVLIHKDIHDAHESPLASWFGIWTKQVKYRCCNISEHVL